MSLLPIDLPGLLLEYLESQKRTPSGLLRSSSEITGSLRHAQLRLAGAPTIPWRLVDYAALEYGTHWHNIAEAALGYKGVPVVRELTVTPWLPEGWGGVADYLFFDPEYKAWVLADLKTQKGEGFHYLEKEGAKEDHIYQLSAYWHALADAGFELVKGFALIYLPKNDVAGKEIEPFVAECEPLDREELWSLMEKRAGAATAYLKDIYKRAPLDNDPWEPDYIDSKFLAPVQERVQKMWWQSKTNTWDVKLVPHWSAAYCPYPNELCDCSEQGTTKIGHYYLTVDGDVPYEARKGYEDIEPLVKPDPKEIKKRAGGNSW